MGFLKEIRRIRENHAAPSPKPSVMQINITSKCPCRCWHCELSEHRDGRHMNRGFLDMCQQQASAWNCTVLYSGGEPMVYPDWRGVLQEGRRLGLHQKLITSGVSLDRLVESDKELLRTSLDELLISVDSSDAETHDALRGVPGLHQRIMEYLSVSDRHENVWLIHVPPLDFSGVDTMLAMARRFGTGLVVQPYITRSNFPEFAPLRSKSGMSDRMPDLAEHTSRTAKTLAESARSHGVVSNLEEVAAFVGAFYRHSCGDSWYGHSVLPAFSCSVPWQQITIDEGGRVLPCSFLPGTKIPPGISLATHWEAQALRYRSEIGAGRIWPECHSCSCHFGTNYRNSILLSPWTNRSGVTTLANKQIMKRWVAMVKNRS